MARKKLSIVTAPAPARALGPGLHGAFLERKADPGFQVRTAAGERLVAILGDGVDLALAEDCLRAGRMVILSDTERGPAIMGALQTSLPIARDADNVLTVEAREIRLRAERALSIEAGPLVISADNQGALRMEGDRLVIDMAAIVRVLSSRVELP